MGLLRLAVLGAPEVFHGGSRLTFPLRKAQALLLYLAVEGGMHPRSNLDAFLWHDSEPHEARAALRNAIALLRHLLADSAASPSHHTHLLSPRDLLGLDPHAPLELHKRSPWFHPRSSAPRWSQSCSTLSPWCAVRFSTASGCARKLPLTSGTSSSSSGRCACCCSSIGSPPVNQKPFAGHCWLWGK